MKKFELGAKTWNHIWRLSWHITRKMTWRSHLPHDMEDFVMEGCMAAVVALPKWNPRRGNLNTYLYPRIRGAVLDMLRREHKQHNSIRARTFTDCPEFLPTMITDDNKHTSIMDVWDELANWKRSNFLEDREFQLLYWRYGMRLSQKDTARRLHLDPSSISAMESDLRLRLGLPPIPRAYFRKPKQKFSKVRPRLVR